MSTDLVVDAVAVWRLTHLVVEDQFPPVVAAREAVLERFGPESPISYLVTCAACVGVWAAAAVTAARVVAPRRYKAATRLLALSSAGPFGEAFLSRLEG